MVRQPFAIAGVRPRFLLGAVVTVSLCVAGALAYARIHLQVDPATGVATYSNFPIPPQRAPAPPAPTAAPAPAAAPTPPVAREAPALKPARPTTSATEATSLKASFGGNSGTLGYRGFPRVSAQLQRERDTERRKILKQELSWEQAELDQALENKAAAEVVRRHKANIEALTREIDNIQ
jgi:hypothetical protein